MNGDRKARRRVGQIASSFDASAIVTTPEGELAPGGTLRGQVGFQVPADATGLVFVFDGDFFGAGKVFVVLPTE